MQKYVKTFGEWLNEAITLSQDDDRIKILKNATLEDYIDKNGNIYLSEQNLTKLPVNFSKLKGINNFYCYNNQLTSLEGAPKEVGRDFYCSYNQLTSLEGAPKEVGRDFDCSNNKVKFTRNDVKKVCNVKGKIFV